MREKEALIMVDKLQDKYNGDIFFINRNEFSYILNKNMIISNEKNQSEQLALRITDDRGVGYAVASGEYDIDKIVENAILTLKYNNEKLNLEDAPMCENSSKVQIYDETIEKLDFRTIELWRRKLTLLVPQALKFQCSISGNIDEIWYYRFVKKNYVRSNSYKKTCIKVIFILYDEKGKTLVYYRNGKDRLFDFIDEIQKKVRNPIVLYPIKTYSKKITDVILSPLGVYCVLKNYIGMFCNGKIAPKKMDNIKFDKGLSIWDKGDIDWQIGSQPFDDEGVECRETVLIQDGQFLNYYTDILSSHTYGKKTTGNARRSWCVPPSPIMNNVIIDSSKKSDDLFEKLNYGLYVDYIEDIGISDNINGIFCGTVIVGYIVYNGKIIGKLKKCKIYINIDKALTDVLTGYKKEWISGDFYTPEILIKNIKIEEI